MTSHARLTTLLVTLQLFVPPVHSAERSLTNYLAGYYGDFAVAVQPDQGLYTYVTGYHYSARSEAHEAPNEPELNGTLGIAGFQYVTKWNIMGGALAFAGYTTQLDGRLSLGGSGGYSEQERGLGDSSISPVVLYWNSGNIHVSVYESIILPTGSFDASAAVNTSRNYISFDTVMAFTWLEPKIGFEISIVPGLMINTENKSTRYRTGTELHLDGMLNFFPTTNVGFGLHGFFYEQIEDDEVGGMENGIRSRSVGLGPAILFIPAPGNGKIVGKWLHEVDVKNRFGGDILSLTAALEF